MIDNLLVKNGKVILSEIPKRPQSINESIKIIIPNKYIDYNIGFIKIDEFIRNIEKEELKFKYEINDCLNNNMNNISNEDIQRIKEEVKKEILRDILLKLI